MTARIREFLATATRTGPCLVVDLDVVRDNYLAFAKALPDTRVFYAVKANPAPEVLTLLAELGSCFDTASVAEIEMVLAAGATPDRISFGNTIKKERDIAARLRARRAPLRGRLRGRGREDRPRRARQRACSAASSATATGPNGRCRASSAASRRWRSTCSSTPIGSASRPTASRSMSARSSAIRTPGTARSPRRPPMFRDCGERGIACRWSISAAASRPSTCKNVPTVKTYGSAIFRALRRHFGNRIPETIIEPGRGMVGNAGVIEAEVVLVSKKSENDDVRWVYLDIGKFGGLAETMDESIRYPIRTRARRRRLGPCVLAGPTCDSADVLYEKVPYPLPVSLEIGDKVLIEGTGAYTTTYSSVAFNGFAPLKTFHI